MKLNTFSIRHGDFEIRTCDKHLCSSYEHITAEFVKWSGSTCITIAYWEKDSAGFYLKFVGDRPFHQTNPMLFFRMARYAQKELDEYFAKLEEDE